MAVAEQQPEQVAGAQEQHILKRFADEYDRNGFSKHFQLHYYQAAGSPTTRLSASSEPGSPAAVAAPAAPLVCSSPRDGAALSAVADAAISEAPSAPVPSADGVPVAPPACAPPPTAAVASAQACGSEEDEQLAKPEEQTAAAEKPEWQSDLPLLHAVAQPDPWDMPGVERGIGVLHDVFGGKDIGEFTMMLELQDLVVPSTAVVRHFVGWLREHSTAFQWQLVAMAIIVKKGLLGQVTRAVVGILTAAVPTSAKFKIFFDEPAAMDWLQESCVEHAAAPPASASKTCGDAGAEDGETSRWWWRRPVEA